MTCGRAKNLDCSCWYLRYIYAAALAFALTLLIFASSANTAMGQAPTSVLELNPLVTEVAPDVSVQADAAQLTETMAASELIATAPEEGAVEFIESVPLDNTFDGSLNDSYRAAFEIAQCNMCAATQSIQLRKNVLGCQARYKVLPQDEIWVVSVRECSCDPENIEKFQVRKLENSCWKNTSLDALSNAHQNDTSRTTMLYVHGNQTNYEYGVARGFQFYDNLFVKYQCPRPPVRLVLWVWKSERELPRLYPDYIVKSHRAVTMGKTLTKTLERLGNRKLAIVGFSLGAQVVLSSLEQLEPNCGCAIAAERRDKYNLALIAPATDPNYICDIIDRNVKSSIVRMSTVIVNSDDRAVKAMRFVIRHECPEAHDRFTKLAKCNRLPLGETEFFEVSHEISRKHAIERYTKSPTAKRAMNAVLSRTAAEKF